MPAPHPVVEVIAGDIYLHDFVLQDETGAPVPVTGQTFSLRILDDEYGAVVPGVTGTASVIDGPGGRVRAQIEEADTTVLLTSSPSCWLRLRNDTTKTTVLSWPLQVKP